MQQREKWRTICRLLCSAINTHTSADNLVYKKRSNHIAIVFRMRQASAVCSHNCNKAECIYVCVLLHRSGCKQTRAAYMVLNARAVQLHSLDAIFFRTRDWSARPIFVYSAVHAGGCDDRSRARRRRSVKMSHPRRRTLSAARESRGHEHLLF
jgi:hypothetical protein